jgi:hypothetical protein
VSILHSNLFNSSLTGKPWRDQRDQLFDAIVKLVSVALPTPAEPLLWGGLRDLLAAASGEAASLIAVLPKAPEAKMEVAGNGADKVAVVEKVPDKAPTSMFSSEQRGTLKGMSTLYRCFARLADSRPAVDRKTMWEPLMEIFTAHNHRFTSRTAPRALRLFAQHPELLGVPGLLQAVADRTERRFLVQKNCLETLLLLLTTDIHSFCANPDSIPSWENEKVKQVAIADKKEKGPPLCPACATPAAFVDAAFCHKCVLPLSYSCCL